MTDKNSQVKHKAIHCRHGAQYIHTMGTIAPRDTQKSTRGNPSIHNAKIMVCIRVIHSIHRPCGQVCDRCGQLSYPHHVTSYPHAPRMRQNRLQQKIFFRVVMVLVLVLIRYRPDFRVIHRAVDKFVGGCG